MKKTVVVLIVAGVLAAVAAGIAIAYSIGGGNDEPEVSDDTVAVIDDEAGDEALNEEEPDTGLDDADADAEADVPEENQENGENNEIADIAEFFSITGEVESVEEDDGMIRVTIEDTDGNPAVLVLNEDVVFPFDEEFDVGDTITGWYKTNAPMIMIWPPQYNIAVLAAGAPEGSNIKVDRFTEWTDHEGNYMLSQDKMFAFTTDDETEIVLANGDDFINGDLEGRKIIVIYGISTRSIPEMATASKLIVLFEDVVAFG